MSDIITEAFEVHDTLNPKLWDTETMVLLVDVRDAIYDIVEEFRDNVLDMTGIEINPVDIQLLGSNASYNYTEYSDLDVHIILNFELLDTNEDLVQALFNLQKSNFNANYDITIKGIDVELYVEDIKASAVSNGIYSIMTSEWIKKPEPIKDIPEVDIEDDLDDWKADINDVLDSNSVHDIGNLIDELYLMRKNGLQSEGEYGAKNQIFKEIRNLGLLNDLKDAYIKLRSKELSLERLDRSRLGYRRNDYES